MVQLRALQATVTHNAFQDHALLLQIIVRGTRSPPASSVIDSNERAVRSMVQGDRADFECRTNQLYRIRFLMLAYPNKQWVRTPPSPRQQDKSPCRQSTCIPPPSFVRRKSPKPTPHPKAVHQTLTPAPFRTTTRPTTPQVYTGAPAHHSSPVQKGLPVCGRSSKPTRNGLRLPRACINRCTITHLFAMVGLLHVLASIYHCLC